MVAFAIAVLGFMLTIAINMIVVSLILYLMIYVGIPTLAKIHNRVRAYRSS